MARQRTPKSGPMALDFDAEAAFEKALVRLAQASQPVPESFLALRLAALLFQVAGVAALVGGVLGAVALARSHLDDSLGFPAEYLSVVVVVVGAVTALLLLVVGDMLTLQLSVARNTRLVSVLLAEMNFADRALLHRSPAAAPAEAVADAAGEKEDEEHDQHNGEHASRSSLGPTAGTSPSARSPISAPENRPSPDPYELA